MGDNHSFQNKRHIFYTERFEIHSERLQAIQNDLKIIQNVLYQNCIPLPFKNTKIDTSYQSFFLCIGIEAEKLSHLFKILEEI